jgi:hypothetical protein
MGKDSILESGEIYWRCSLNRQNCKAKIRTDADSTRILSGTLDHNHPASDRSLERKLGHDITEQLHLRTYNDDHCKGRVKFGRSNSYFFDVFENNLTF